MPGQIIAPGAPYSIPQVYNFSPTNLSRWRAGVAAQRLGTRDAVINVIGDSRTAGSNANNNGYVGARPFVWPVQLASLLTQKGLSAHVDSIFGDQNTPAAGTAYNLYDTRVVQGTGWGKDATHWAIGPGSTFTNTTSTVGVLAFTPANSFDTLTIYYITGGAFGSFTTNVDGGASLGTISTNGSNGVAKTTYTVTAGTHTVNLQASSLGNGVFIYGIETSLSTARKTNVRCLGCGGASSGWWSTITSPWAGVAPIATPLGGDLAIVCIDVNDSVLGNTVATYQTNMTYILNTLSAAMDVIVVGGVAGNTVTNPLYGDPSLATFENAAKTLAISKGLPFIDWKSRWVDFTTANTLGLFGTGPDALHPGPTGYLDQAGMIASLLLSDGIV